MPKYYLLLAIIGWIVGFLAISYWPQRVTFSYQGQTCIGQPHFAPNSFSAVTDTFKLASEDVTTIQTTPLIAKKICLTPQSAPRSGDHSLSYSLPGIPFLRKHVTVHVPDYPMASAVQLKKPIPISKKLVIGLTTSDTIFSYKLQAADKTTDCENQIHGVTCDIKKLGLTQGVEYDLQLDRYFKSELVATVLKTRVATLKATTLVSSTIKEGEMVFTLPDSMTLQFDKPVANFEASLVGSKGEQETRVSIDTIIKGSEVTIKWQGDLPRQQLYKLALRHVQATDGSLVEESNSVNFRTSGGPTVQSIDIGTSKVALNSTATITFDQPLLEKQAIEKIITVTGGAKLIGYEGQRATVSFANVPRCTDVVIKISDDLVSSNGIKGGSAWEYKTRTICHTVISIGSSVKGRSIQAYVFGAGEKKVVYTGTIHGDERGTRALMLSWINTLEANPRSIPSDKTVIIIPMINPDGYASGTRTNARNVDLNRNFGTADWKQDITTVNNRPFPGGGGSAPFSEPESMALANYVTRVQPTVVISYHSIGGLVVANQIGISNSLAKRYANLSGYRNATGVSTTFDYSVSGTADDYYGEIIGIPSILVEIGSHTDSQFAKNQSALWAMLRES